MRHLLPLLCLTCGLAAVDGVAEAREDRPLRDALLERFDADGDGRLDENERAAMKEARRERLLDRFDANDDGELDADERAAAREQHRDRQDRKGDGKRRQRLERLFDRADQDDDGQLSKQEFLRAIRHLRQWRQERRQDSGEGESNGDGRRRDIADEE